MGEFEYDFVYALLHIRLDWGNKLCHCAIGTSLYTDAELRPNCYN